MLCGKKKDEKPFGKATIERNGIGEGGPYSLLVPLAYPPKPRAGGIIKNQSIKKRKMTTI